VPQKNISFKTIGYWFFGFVWNKTVHKTGLFMMRCNIDVNCFGAFLLVAYN